jgi:hypothetical protein
MPAGGMLFITVAVLTARSILAQTIAQTPAPSVTTLYTFQGGSDGSDPRADLLIGPDGSLYGTTNTGGTSDLGTVFQLRRPDSASERWTETVLHNFAGQPDGEYPGTSLVFYNGALYGITGSGGAFGAGLAFELKPSMEPGSAWTETVIHNFTGGADGSDPVGGLVRGTNGALYGATALGGSPCAVYYGCGVVFELEPAPAAGIAWIETVLHSFQGGSDGVSPPAGVVFGRDGALYGTTNSGGTPGYGMVFRLRAPAAGERAWTETVLHSFTNQNGDGAYPQAAVVAGYDGAVYGTASAGGFFPRLCSTGCGIVFELTQSTAAGDWTETVIHRFAGFPNDGALPVGSLLLGWNGALYGTTEDGGSVDCPAGRFGLPGCGVIFKLGRASGAWSETILHNFAAGRDGSHPYSGLVLGDRALFGTTSLGGAKAQSCQQGCGTVFVLTRWEQ